MDEGWSSRARVMGGHTIGIPVVVLSSCMIAPLHAMLQSNRLSIGMALLHELPSTWLLDLNLRACHRHTACSPT